MKTPYEEPETQENQEGRENIEFIYRGLCTAHHPKERGATKCNHRERKGLGREVGFSK